MRRVFWSSIWLIPMAFFLGCQSSPESKTIPTSGPVSLARPPIKYVPFERPIEENLPAFARGEASYLAVDLSNGKVLSSLEPQTYRVPASVTKLVSGYGALGVLGASQRFQTKVVASGLLKDGVLKGDLVLVGGGDPVLYVSHLMDLAFALKKKGLRKVEGRFLFDESYFASEPAVGSLPGTEASAYNPGFSALSIEFNRMPLHARATGNETMVWPALDVPWSFEIGGGRAAQWRETGAGEVWSLSPSFLDDDDKPALPVKHPAKLTAQMFAKVCAMQGIALPTPEKGNAPARAILLAEHLSPPVETLLESSWEHSNNLVAEILFRHALKKLGNANNPQLLKSWLQKNVPGADWMKISLDNGSGLSTKNRFTAGHFVALLKKMKSESVAGRPLISRLPIAGWKGSLRESFSEPDIAMKVWAKTGSLSYHSALSGYAFTDRGTPVAFAILLTDPKGRSDLEASFSSEEENVAAEKTAHDWSRESRSFQNRLVAYWIKKF